MTAALAASLALPELPAQSAALAAPPETTAPADPAPQTAAPPSDSTTPAPASSAPVPAPATDTAKPAPAADAAKTAQPANAAKTATSPNGEIVVSGERGLKKIDPVMGANKVSFEVIEGVDKALIGPIMNVYRNGVPAPVRQGLHNFFFNLTEPVNALNYVLQLHPGKALRTVARFGINSTVGVAGVIDVAKKKPFNFHYRPNGFGNTFGYYGIGPGPYLFLPLVGPTSVRDLVGSLLDQAALPLVFKPLKNYYYVIAAGVITELDYRVDIDAGVQRVRATGNPYASYRQAYLKSRAEEIEALHGRGPLANGEIGQPPFVRPLHDEPAPPPVASPALTPAPAATPPTAMAPPPAPPPPVFISNPVIQPHPTVQPLPPGYRPGGS